MSLFEKQNRVYVLGAGPAGMGCSYALACAGTPCTVIDRETEPGGLCRTLNFHDYYFDIGGHRFLSRSPEINHLWQDMMDGDMLCVRRLSRIFYKKKYFNYPLSFSNTFWNFGPLESFLCIASYLRCMIFKPGDESTFEGWITNHFGRRLYEIFFRTYTEKVWAVPCKDISANWAKQRIRGLSLRVAIQNAMMGLKGDRPKTLADEFLYPARGPGEFYRRLAGVVSSRGSSFHFNKNVVQIHHRQGKIISVETETDGAPTRDVHEIDYLFSSLPLPYFVQHMNPAAPTEVLEAARKLRFRNFLVVNIILDRESIFPDQWIYVHSPEVRLGRIQNYKNWSRRMVRDTRKTSLGLEYFCNDQDELWSMNEVDLIQYALSELEKIKIVSRRHLIEGFVVRCRDVYPIYALDYQRHLAILRSYVGGFSNLQTMGRAGLFRYDNSDHALLSGIYAARNYEGAGGCDLWQLNTDENYLES